jgi:putative flippase GtrA
VFVIVGLGGAGMQIAAYTLAGDTLTPVPLAVAG